MLCDRTIDSTKGCAALKEHYSFGHRLSHHSDLLQHVDGSATVRENGCLSTTTSSTGNGSLATTIPSVRGRGATCAKVWNAVRREKRDCIFYLRGEECPKGSSCKFQHMDSFPIAEVRALIATHLDSGERCNTKRYSLCHKLGLHNDDGGP